MKTCISAMQTLQDRNNATNNCSLSEQFVYARCLFRSTYILKGVHQVLKWSRNRW